MKISRNIKKNPSREFFVWNLLKMFSKIPQGNILCKKIDLFSFASLDLDNWNWIIERKEFSDLLLSLEVKLKSEVYLG